MEKPDDSNTQRVADLESAINLEQVEPEVPPVAKHGHAQTKGFAAETAAATGMDEPDDSNLNDDSKRQRVADLESAINLEVEPEVPPQFAGQLGGARPQTKGFAAETAAATGMTKLSFQPVDHYPVMAG